jgi:hypothetical protein
VPHVDLTPPLIARVHRENFGVYGVDKVWAQLGREGVRVIGGTVAGLMRELRLGGVVRGKPGFETRPTPVAGRGAGLREPGGVLRRYVAGATITKELFPSSDP